MRVRLRILAAILILGGCLPVVLLAARKESGRGKPVPAFMDVQLDASVKLSHLKCGDTLEGSVTRNVFSGYYLIVPRASRVRMRVSAIKRGPREHNHFWPWPIPYFLPKYERLPSFDFADVFLPDGEKVRLRVLVASAIDEIHVAAHTRPKAKSGAKAGSSSSSVKRGKARKRLSGPRIELVVDAGGTGTDNASSIAAANSGSHGVSLSGIETLSAGSKAKLALLGTLSASKSRAGDHFKALLEEPIRLDSGQILPEGTIFEGRVTRSVPPRWLSRPGALYLIFTRLVLPKESVLPIAASVAGVDVSHRSRIKVSSEGGMSGGSPGKARLLLDLGVGVGISKVADDGYQLVTEALVSTATDVSTAGTARLIGFAFSGLYLLTRHGRDVTLPRYTTVTIRFGRAPSLPSPEIRPQPRGAL